MTARPHGRPARWTHVDDALPPTIRRYCPVNGCHMLTGPTGAVYPGMYDGVLHWRCPVCSANWHRWPPGHPLRQRAAMVIGPWS